MEYWQNKNLGLNEFPEQKRTLESILESTLFYL